MGQVLWNTLSLTIGSGVEQGEIEVTERQKLDNNYCTIKAVLRRRIGLKKEESGQPRPYGTFC
ncbi:hypothetical protein OUZ56_002817 [Daphnia magna]|uniref:Uncharacterized protein n=1 Tax=Daphnia magna TaxID=35525 RepID=A0ABR0A7C7_9CRUS|nr:hypothetical protein OUZ56_002817 [Daphnia magna]